jgi:hypothetical protein
MVGSFGTFRNWNSAQGIFSGPYVGGYDTIRAENVGFNWNRIDFDASRVVPSAAENRPVNMAVRYLIKALK